MKSFVTCTLQQILLEWSNQWELDGVACSTHRWDEKCIQNFDRKPKYRWLTYSKLTNPVEQNPSWEANSLSASQRNSPHFMAPESSLPLSEEPATCPYRVTDAHSSRLPTLFRYKGIDGKIILKWILKRYEGLHLIPMAQDGYQWRFMVKTVMNCRVHVSRISWPAEQLLASEDGFCSM
jgi:hypothetical protein